ncbi:hypothetical protein EJB05_44820, partial [Eragrostis curvula]
MEFTMEVVAGAVASEIVGRIFSCVIDNLLSSRGRARDAHRQRLDIYGKVEEAEGRHITNLSLLDELQVVTDAMHRGRFALEVADLNDDADVAAEEEAITTGKRKLAAHRSPLNVVKRSSLTTEKRLAAVVEELEALTRDHMRSFIELVKEYPRRNNVPRPLTTTLFMDRCVVGRHVETERVVAFLLQPTPRSAGLSALAVVGDGGVGKTTLLKHVCHDERVRGHFSHVEWFYWADMVITRWSSDGTEYPTVMRRILDEPRFRAVGRSLLVFDHSIWWPTDESAWAALLATSKLAEGSKLLFTAKNANLGWLIGTVEPVDAPAPAGRGVLVLLQSLRVRRRGPAGPPAYIAAVGREISRNLGSRFVDARVLGELLRANFDARFWCKVLAAVVHRSWPVDYYSVLTDLLSIRGWTWIDGCGKLGSLPKTKLTLPDVLRAAATSSSGSGLGGGDRVEAFTVYCREELYTENCRTIVFAKDGWVPRLFAEEPNPERKYPGSGSSEISAFTKLLATEISSI